MVKQEIQTTITNEVKNEKVILKAKKDMKDFKKEVADTGKILDEFKAKFNRATSSQRSLKRLEKSNLKGDISSGALVIKNKAGKTVEENSAIEKVLTDEAKARLAIEKQIAATRKRSAKTQAQKNLFSDINSDKSLRMMQERFKKVNIDMQKSGRGFSFKEDGEKISAQAAKTRLNDYEQALRIEKAITTEKNKQAAIQRSEKSAKIRPQMDFFKDMGVDNRVTQLKSDLDKLNVTFKKVSSGYNVFTNSAEKNRQALIRNINTSKQEIANNEKRTKSLFDFSRAMGALSLLFAGQAMAMSIQRLALTAVQSYQQITKAQTDVGQGITMLSANFQYLRFVLGNAIATALEPMIPALISIITNVAEFIAQHPGLVAWGLGIGFIITKVMALSGQVILLIAGVRALMGLNTVGAWEKVGTSVANVKTKMFTLTAGIWTAVAAAVILFLVFGAMAAADYPTMADRIGDSFSGLKDTFADTVVVFADLFNISIDNQEAWMLLGATFTWVAANFVGLAQIVLLGLSQMARSVKWLFDLIELLSIAITGLFKSEEDKWTTDKLWDDKLKEMSDADQKTIDMWNDINEGAAADTMRLGIGGIMDEARASAELSKIQSQEDSKKKILDDKRQEDLESQKQYVTNSSEIYTDMANGLKDIIIPAQDFLTSAIGATGSSTNELLGINNDLIGQSPNKIKAIDDETEAYKRQIEVIKELKEKQAELSGDSQTATQSYSAWLTSNGYG